MPIDTATKRYSAINVSSPWRGVLPLPDGTIDAGDRQIVPFLYSGILAEEPAEVVVVVPAPAEQAQGAGRVYAPTRRRKPRRIVFLEREILEQLERQKELEEQARQLRAEAPVSVTEQRDVRAELARTVAAVEALAAEVSVLRSKLERMIADERDDEDAIQMILQTLH